MTTARVSSKGQVVIPAKIRRRLGIEEGTTLIVDERDGAIILRPATREYFDSLAGILAGGPSLAKELLEERARDRENEDR